MSRMKAALEFINKNPRIILLMSWPVLTAMLIGVTLIIWLGPWIVSVAIQMKQLDLLGVIAIGIMTILGFNQLAQSSTFFGKLGLKLGTLFDLSADMDSELPPKEDQ